MLEAGEILIVLFLIHIFIEFEQRRIDDRGASLGVSFTFVCCQTIRCLAEESLLFLGLGVIITSVVLLVNTAAKMRLNGR